jgi:DNA-3-methyladenine glycosylase
MPLRKLPTSFYRQPNVLLVAKDLLGKLLCTNIDGHITTGRIVETEAYNGIIDRAAHSYNGRRTARTEVMYQPGGVAYVYLCYGIHQMFNIVTGEKDNPQAVLIRAVAPVTGLDVMLRRRGKKVLDKTLTRGPGSVGQALGITTAHTGMSLLSDTIWIADDGYQFTKKEIASSPRIGVAYAAADALLPYRFYVKGNLFVSVKIK